ncbi:signal transduction histidine kinase [Marinomonas foliarum]|uniref:histidine kinase n=2 Tax=Marinomonas foliarum TaxID=491950 RepID=A0A368ZY23_9GAMM|nr:signal transduction histidine kinase [Marinomonas foliarum]
MLSLKNRFKHSLKYRLIITFFVALTLLISGIYSYLFVMNPNLLIGHILNEQAEFLIDEIYTNSMGEPELSIQKSNQDAHWVWIYETLNEDLFFQIVDPQGEVVSASTRQTKAFAPDNTSYNKHTSNFTFTRNNKLFYGLSEPLKAAYTGYNIQVATSLRLLEVFQITKRSPISKTVLLVSILSLFIVSFAVIITIHFMLRPLRKASDIASKITPQNIQGRLSMAEMPSELIPLISAFNEALERLEQGFKVQQEFLATAAHELKTPLALIRGEIEMLEKTNSKNLILEDVDHISRQINQLLHLAEVRESHNYTFQDITLVNTVNDTIKYLSRLSKKHGTSIRLIQINKDIHLNADASTLFILLKNLIENAIYHSPSGTTIDITMTKNTVSVRDYGQGINEEHLNLIFKRFWRAPKQKIHGAGLGLAICMEIATFHGWKVTAKNSSPGASFVLDMSP